MRIIMGVLLASAAMPAAAQVYNPPITSGPSQADVAAAKDAATQAAATAQAALTAAQNAATAQALAAADAKAQQALTAAQAAATAAAGTVKTVNNATPDASGKVTLALPTVPVPATTAPPGGSDSGTVGTMMEYARANHTHPSKARRERVLVPASGTLAITFRDTAGNPAPFTNVPVCATSAETTKGDTNVVNAQIDGQPTTTGMTMRITRTAITVASLLGLSVLSVPTQIATYAHYVCLEP